VPSLPPWWLARGGSPTDHLEPAAASRGKLGLALLWLAAASRGGLVAVVDLAERFPPPLPPRAWIRPPDRRGAAEAVSLLLSSAASTRFSGPEWQTRPFNLTCAPLTLAARQHDLAGARHGPPPARSLATAAEDTGNDTARSSRRGRASSGGWEWT
jgi:hypothetical protein